MANWTPEGFVGKNFGVMAKMVPPPPVPPPILWGDESVVRQRLASGTKQISCVRQYANLLFPFSPKEVVELFRQHFGPTQTAFARLDEAGRAALAAQLEQLYHEHNLSKKGDTEVQGEYLEVRAIRA
jgi:hypothetical protein